MSNFNSHESFDFNDTTQRTASVENQPHYGVEKVTHQSESGSEVTITGGDSINGILNTDLSRATENNPVTFPATPASSSPLSDYYVHGRQIKYRVTTNVSPGTILGSVSVDNETKNNQNTDIVEGSTHNVVATPVSPCTFQNWTGDYDKFTEQTQYGNSKTISSSLLNDMTVTANFNCYVQVQDPTGDVYKNPSGCSVVPIEGGALVDYNNCFKYFAYPLNPNYFQPQFEASGYVLGMAYSAHYEKVDDFKAFSYTYHARGWASDSNSTYSSPKYVQPEYDVRTCIDVDTSPNIAFASYAQSGVRYLPPLQDNGDNPCYGVMFFRKRRNEPYSLSECDLATKFDDTMFGPSYGYAKPISSGAYETSAEYTNDNTPPVPNFISLDPSGLNWGSFCIVSSSSTEPTNSSGRWMIASSSYGIFPRSSWIIIEPKSDLATDPETGVQYHSFFNLDPSRFDISGIKANDSALSSVNNVNDLLGNGILTENQPVWFELETKQLDVNTLPSNTDIMLQYTDDEVDFYGNTGFIYKINGQFITDDSSAYPTYIAYITPTGHTEVYQKVVDNKQLVRKVCTGGNMVGPDNIDETAALSNTTSFMFGDTQCGDFNGWVSIEDGEVVDEDNTLTVERPSGCCKIYRPGISSCSYRYYPYGYCNSASSIYFRCFLIPYVEYNENNYISWIQPNEPFDSYGMDCNSVIENGMQVETYESSLDDVFFVINPNEVFYSFGMPLLDPVEYGNTAEYEEYSGREIQAYTGTYGVMRYNSVDFVKNTSNVKHYYRIGYYDTSKTNYKVLTEYENCKLSNYNTIDEAFTSSEPIIWCDYIDSSLQNPNYMGMRVSDSVVYRNDCSIKKGVSTLICTDENDTGDWANILSTLTEPSYYVDYGVTKNYFNNSQIKRFFKTYEPVVSSPNYDYGYNTGMISWSQMGDAINSGICHLTGQKHLWLNKRSYMLFRDVQQVAGTDYYYQWDPLYDNYPYDVNEFDCPYFNFSFGEFIPVSENIKSWSVNCYYLITGNCDSSQGYYETIENYTRSCNPYQTTLTNGYANYPDNLDARECNMIPGKFLLSNNSRRLVLITNSNKSYYTDQSQFVIGTDEAEPFGYFMAYGGIAYNDMPQDLTVRFIKDNQPTYTAGHYAYGTDETDETTFGLWWPMSVTDIAGHCQSLGLDTYSISSSVLETSNEKYILLKKDISGYMEAYYYANSQWNKYATFPSLIKLSTQDGSLIIMEEVQSEEISNYDIGDIYVADDNDCISSFYEKQYYFSGGTLSFDDIDGTITRLENNPSFKCFCRKNGVVKNKDISSGLYSVFSLVDTEATGIRGGYSGERVINDFNGLISALEDESRFIYVNQGFTYNGTNYATGAYRLNISDEIHTSGNNEFYTEASLLWDSTNSTYETLKSGFEIENALDNLKVYVPVEWDDSNISVYTEMFCTNDGFDKNGTYIGFPDEYNKPYCGLLYESGTNCVFRNLSCDCKNEGYGFMPIIFDGESEYSCVYKREIYYDSVRNAYFIRKYGYYVNDEFIEVPENGIKWLKLSDDGVRSRIFNTLLESISTERLSNGMTRMSIDLDTYGGNLVKTSYDYVYYPDTPNSYTNVATTSALIYARDTNHNEYIKTTQDIYALLTDSGVGTRFYPSNTYWKLNYNYRKTLQVTHDNTQDNLVLDFLGWFIEGNPKYTKYCDIDGNTSNGIVDIPTLGEYEMTDESPVNYKTIYSALPDEYHNFIESQEDLFSYTTVTDAMDLDFCLQNAEPFKVELYDNGLSYIIGFDGYQYDNGSYYVPNDELLITAIKYGFPDIEIGSGNGDINYGGKVYQEELYYRNVGADYVIHNANEVNSVFARGGEFVFISEYGSVGEEAINEYEDVSNVDDLIRAIANRTEYIRLLEDITYHFTTYLQNAYYKYNKIVINGVEYHGGDYLIRKENTLFVPVENSVLLQPCQTGTAVFSRKFKINFCTPDGYSTTAEIPSYICASNPLRGSSDPYNMLYSYDGELIGFNTSGDYSESDMFSIDHRHFTGGHKLGFFRASGVCGNNSLTDNDENPGCRIINGYAFGDICNKSGQGVNEGIKYQVNIDPDGINDISNYINGVFPTCNDYFILKGGCGLTTIKTNDEAALFGEIDLNDYINMVTDQGISEYNENYPFYNYLSYTEPNYVDQNDPEPGEPYIQTWYEWISGEYVKTNNKPNDATIYNTYPLTAKWEDGCFALKKHISVGVYKVHIEEYVGEENIDNENILEFQSGLARGMTNLYSFPVFLASGDNVDEHNKIFKGNMLDFRVEPHALYKVTYKKINNASERLKNSSNYMELFLTVIDPATAPTNIWQSGYVELTWNELASIDQSSMVVVNNETELSEAIISGVPVFTVAFIDGSDGIEYNGFNYISGWFYGNPSLFRGVTYSFLSGGCGSSQFLKYMTNTEAVTRLNQPTITFTNIQGNQYKFQIGDTNNQNPNVKYMYKCYSTNTVLSFFYTEYDLTSNGVEFTLSNDETFTVCAYATGCGYDYVNSNIVSCWYSWEGINSCQNE